MAAGAALGRLNIPVVDKLLALFKLSGGTAGMLPIEIGDELGITDELLWSAMALQAPSHRERFIVSDDGHLVDLAMALDTRNAAGDVDGVIKINVVRSLVNSYPRHGVAGCVTLTHGR